MPDRSDLSKPLTSDVLSDCQLTYLDVQICISPDYVLVPRGRLDEVEASFRKMYNVLWPKSQIGRETEWSKIINPVHHERLRKLVESSQGKVILGGKHDEREGKMELTIVSDVKPDDPLMVGCVELRFRHTCALIQVLVFAERYLVRF